LKILVRVNFNSLDEGGQAGLFLEVLEPMKWQRVFLIVTGCSLAGMCLGGLFGLGAGMLAPRLFQHFIIWQEVEPVGVAVFFGATAGVILGGSLGCFGILIELIMEWRKHSTKS
jgi:hypothetical protein